MKKFLVENLDQLLALDYVVIVPRNLKNDSKLYLRHNTQSELKYNQLYFILF